MKIKFKNNTFTCSKFFIRLCKECNENNKISPIDIIMLFLHLFIDIVMLPIALLLSWEIELK